MYTMFQYMGWEVISNIQQMSRVLNFQSDADGCLWFWITFFKLLSKNLTIHFNLLLISNSLTNHQNRLSYRHKSKYLTFSKNWPTSFINCSLSKYVYYNTAKSLRQLSSCGHNSNVRRKFNGGSILKFIPSYAWSFKHIVRPANKSC